MTSLQVSLQSSPDPAFSSWVSELMRHLRSRLPNREDAEDITQEACLQFVQARRKERDMHNPRAYLFTIAHHLLYHRYAAQSRRPRPTELDFEEVSAADEIGTDDQVMHSACVEKINRAARELSPKCRQALTLKWHKEMRVAEIAEHMGLSKGMVKKYLAQGLTHFRRRLKPDDVAEFLIK